MSTHQPPGGAHDGASGYSPPQDPWAGGYEPGLASVPTDPIPQQYDAYAGMGAGDVWSQPTVAAGAPVGPPQFNDYQPAPRRGRGGLVFLVVLAVLILGGGGGFAAYRIVTTNKTASASSTTPASSTPAAPTTSAAFDLHTVKVGDCLVNLGTESTPNLAARPCSTAGSFKVIKIASGAAIPKGPQGTFDRDTTSVTVCVGTGYTTWYGYQLPTDHAQDLFFCMVTNGGGSSSSG